MVKTKLTLGSPVEFKPFEGNEPTEDVPMLVLTPDGMNSAIPCRYSMRGKRWTDLETGTGMSTEGTWWSHTPDGMIEEV